MPTKSSKLARLVYLVVCIIISHGFTITHHFLNKSIYIFYLGEGEIVYRVNSPFDSCPNFDYFVLMLQTFLT